MERRENAIEGDRERTDFVEFTPEADRTTQNDGERLYSAVRMYGGGRKGYIYIKPSLFVIHIPYTYDWLQSCHFPQNSFMLNLQFLRPWILIYFLCKISEF